MALCYHGAGSMVNYGLSHKMFCVKPLHRNFLHRSAQSLIPSPRATVFVFIKATNALWVVPSCIFAIGVKGRTWWLSVIFVTRPNSTIPSPKLPNPFLPSLPTPIKGNRLVFLLDGYSPSTVEFLLSGFTKGFPVHFEGERTSQTARNLLSALKNPEVVDAKLGKEFAAHRLAGPFLSPPLSPFRISPLGIVPKKVPGEFRLIHHLSFPKGSSVNDGISPEHTSVRNTTIDEAIKLIMTAGHGCFLAKTDIKNAFRIIPIHPIDYGLLGMQWRGLYYYDRCMPMGCSSSCLTFETFSTAVEWIARHKLKIDCILHLLDDFLLIASSSQLCKKQLEFIFISLFLPRYPNGTREDLWSGHHRVFCGHWIRLYSFGGSFTSWKSWKIFFTDLLNRSLRTCGLHPALYKGHSFRIGAASFAADRGMSDAQLRALGRWKSNAFLKYIRIPSIST